MVWRPHAYKEMFDAKMCKGAKNLLKRTFNFSHLKFPNVKIRGNFLQGKALTTFFAGLGEDE